MKEGFIVTYEQNADEYLGELFITAERLEQTGKIAFTVDGVEIVLDGLIKEIETVSIHELHRRSDATGVL